MNKNTIGVIGLAMRAGKLVFGSEACVEAIRNKKAFLLISVSDVSDNTAKLLADKSNYYSVRHVKSDLTMQELGRAIGRRSAAAAAFTDANFVKAFDKSVGADNKE